jgi:hypothetical protein
MSNQNYFILLGSIDDSTCLVTDADVVWTSHKAANPDDVVFFYITAPVSAIVASGIVEGDYWLNEDIESRWEGKLMNEISILRGIDSPKPHVSMRRLREIFPEWNWLRYPRQNTQIPADLIEPFLELMNL